MGAHDGWSMIRTSNWNDAPPRVRGRLFQNIIEGHLIYDARREKRPVRERVDKYSWLLENPIEVSIQDSTDVVIFICVTFNHQVIDGKDCIVPDIRRKVRSKDSIWTEIQGKTWTEADNEDGANEDQWLLVKVANSKDPKKMNGARLVKIRYDLCLNDPWKEGQSESIADYWRREGWGYTNEQASTIPVAEVQRPGTRQVLRYPADQVFRQMTTDQWKSQVWTELEPYLQLKPTEYFKLVEKALRWFSSIKIGDDDIGSGIEAGWNQNWNLFDIPSNLLASVEYSIQDKVPLFNNKGQWRNHLKSFETIHGTNPPHLNLYYVTTPEHKAAIPMLQRQVKGIFSQIPGWSYTDSSSPLFIEEGTRSKVRSQILDLTSTIEQDSGEKVVISGLWSGDRNRSSKIYNPLKHSLTNSGICHQNFGIVQSNFGLKLNAPDQYFSHAINACQLLIKLGIMPVPWTSNLGNIDLIAGIDIGRRGRNKSYPALAVSLTREGKLWGTSTMMEPQPGEAISEEALFKLIHDLIYQYEQSVGSRPDRILLLRDGYTPSSEFEGFMRVSDEFFSEGVDICWVTVPKQGAPRLLLFNEFGRPVDTALPSKGQWLQSQENGGIIWTTGGGDLKPGMVGIPVGLRFEILKPFNIEPIGTSQMAALLTLHAHASQVSPFRSTRLPFPLHLADKLAKAIVRGSIPPEIDGNRFPAV